MEIICSVQAMQAQADAWRREGRRLALVPTMGALHEGHLTLVRTAQKHSDHVTVSIFVNPTQFGPSEDYARYPRQLEKDLAMLEALGVDVAFAPTVAEMYPEGPEANLTWVYVEKLDAHLCGRYRPGHFRGVATVVAKLFNICKPHVAVFGLKDAQQFQIIRRMVRDLHYDVELIGVPTVREPDGLALSSRNAYLSQEERKQAVVLSWAVEAARQAIEAGEQRPEAIVEAMRQVLSQAPLARVQYVEVVDAETLQPVTRIRAGQRVLVGLAVFFGDTRLIDNVFVEAPGG